MMFLHNFVFFFSGSVHRTINRASLPSGLYGVSKSERHRRSQFRERDGLSRGAKFARDIRRRVTNVRQKRTPKRGDFVSEYLSHPPSQWSWIGFSVQVVVPKMKGEILGVVIVESGWGSMLPTVVIANLAPAGAAARCGQVNIGDQIIAVNGVSLVGLPLSTCQNYIKVL